MRQRYTCGPQSESTPGLELTYLKRSKPLHSHCLWPFSLTQRHSLDTPPVDLLATPPYTIQRDKRSLLVISVDVLNLLYIPHSNSETRTLMMFLFRRITRCFNLLGSGWSLRRYEGRGQVLESSIWHHLTIPHRRGHYLVIRLARDPL